MLVGIAQFERDLMSARGKKLGRQHGQRLGSNRLAPKVMALIEEGRSYRWIALISRTHGTRSFLS